MGLQILGVVNGPSKNTGLAKFFCEVSRVSQSRFFGGCQRLRVSNFCKVVSDYGSQSRILKGKKVSVSQKKNASFAVSLFNTIRHP